MDAADEPNITRMCGDCESEEHDDAVTVASTQQLGLSQALASASHHLLKVVLSIGKTVQSKYQDD